ncbi:MAG: hypothetical protein HY937_08960 [Nitrosomonadales bacterium]|nr:hypothetical protein [Nitrosomonadales bacterium]
MNISLNRQPRVFILASALLWFGIYQIFNPLSRALVNGLPVDRGSHLYDALQFFFYDTPRMLLLLVGLVTVMDVVNSYFTPGRSEGSDQRLTLLREIVREYGTVSNTVAPGTQFAGTLRRK